MRATSVHWRHDDGACPLCGHVRRDDDGVILAGPLRLEAGAVSMGGHEIVLPPGTFRVLAVYARRAGRPVARESVMAAVYGDAENPPDAKVIDVAVCRLRTLLGFRAFETRWGGIRIFHPDRCSFNPDSSPLDAVSSTERRARWTADEDAQVRALHATGTADRGIALVLKGRTPEAVRERRRALGLQRTRGRAA